MHYHFTVLARRSIIKGNAQTKIVSPLVSYPMGKIARKRQHGTLNGKMFNNGDIKRRMAAVQIVRPDAGLEQWCDFVLICQNTIAFKS